MKCLGFYTGSFDQKIDFIVQDEFSLFDRWADFFVRDGWLFGFGNCFDKKIISFFLTGWLDLDTGSVESSRIVTTVQRKEFGVVCWLDVCTVAGAST